MSKQTQDSATVSELLPWYINGTLSDSEKQRVEAALKTSESLQQELQWLKIMQEPQVTPAVELSDDEVDTQYALVMQKIAQQEATESSAAQANVTSIAAAKDVETNTQEVAKPQREPSSGVQQGSSIWQDMMQGVSDILNSFKSLLPQRTWVPAGAAFVLCTVALLGYQNVQSPQQDDIFKLQGPLSADNLNFSVTTTKPLTPETLKVLVISKGELNPEVELHVSQVSEQQFKLIIPASLDSKVLNKLLFSLQSTADIQRVVLEAPTDSEQ